MPLPAHGQVRGCAGLLRKRHLNAPGHPCAAGLAPAQVAAQNSRYGERCQLWHRRWRQGERLMPPAPAVSTISYAGRERAWSSSSLDVKRAAIGCGGCQELPCGSCLLLRLQRHASTPPECFGAFDALADALVQRAGGARAAFIREGMSAGVMDVRCGMMTMRVLSLAGLVLREPLSDPKSKVKRGCEQQRFPAGATQRSKVNALSSRAQERAHRQGSLPPQLRTAEARAPSR